MARKWYSRGEAVRFKSIFGVELADYWDDLGFLGLDVIKFDEWLSVPDGESTREYIVHRFGESAADFVRNLSMRVR